ncbi:MAG: hypothetical protein LAN18_14855 [Acidobacteriia bacterium]|nr:hypothetical protein [Terriglobia bacterium]
MTVDDFAAVLLSRDLDLVQDGNYENKLGQIGYRAIYRNSGCYYWYSVSGTDTRVAPDEVATAITTSGRIIQREYPYLNSRGKQGFEATVRSGDHSFMLNSAPDPPRI